MSTSVKSNLYALLSDDAEDATEAVVRKASTQDKTKTSSASTKTTTSKVKIPQVDSLPVAEEDTTLAEEEDKEKHSPHKLERHHVQVVKKHGREFDRHSGTGRGKEISKGGAGGRYVFGNPEEEARKLSQGVNTAFRSGLKDDEAVRSVEENIVDEVEGEETEQETITGTTTSGKVEEEPKETLTLDEYLARQAEKKLQLASLLGNKPAKAKETNTLDDSLKPWRREDEDDPTLSEIGQKNLQQNAANNRQKDAKNKTVDMTKEFFSEPPRRGRGRGSRRVGRGSGPRGTTGNFRREVKSEDGTVQELLEDSKDSRRRGGFSSRPFDSRGYSNGPSRRGFSSRGASSRGGRGGGRGGFRESRISTPSISDPTDFPTLS
ncbi:hypothetical protein Gasu2_28890 [Galdieria sulphuraria]|uniref:Hyaluronan/mRNA-binding protein domain-containing protein n=1 Tax=Galdieria sulphuraria TaxID=130081 RepID=M2Y362_GALSU|nr:uncharacterized protein Gasu_22800 [Galdieria sulphuraria]EME30373.1 hypothetical protein Gasu_22800 [Galdieria sulphuraria]GJD08595.1 hypothetical protein Gasu2_28890 [Galdieria sulphuraria]|eukprot:XP_005706893.1 hypothetical protein Gasu_22800 [Galdieria sulphuraria]